MDPLLGKIAATMLEKAVTSLTAQITQAQAFANDDVRRCKAYLETARDAIQALENEYDAILNQAEVCDLGQRQQILDLQQRLLDYLHLDRLRNVLWDVHAGLKGCRNALQENNERFLILPGVREKRQEAIADFVQTMETLEQYIADLQNHDLAFRKAGTGVGIKWLNGIKDLLVSADILYAGANPPAPDQLARIRTALVDYIAIARQDRSKDRLEDATSRIRATVEKLLRTFR